MSGLACLSPKKLRPEAIRHIAITQGINWSRGGFDWRVASGSGLSGQVKTGTFGKGVGQLQVPDGG